MGANEQCVRGISSLVNKLKHFLMAEQEIFRFLFGLLQRKEAVAAYSTAPTKEGIERKMREEGGKISLLIFALERRKIERIWKRGRREDAQIDCKFIEKWALFGYSSWIGF